VGQKRAFAPLKIGTKSQSFMKSWS